MRRNIINIKRGLLLSAAMLVLWAVHGLAAGVSVSPSTLLWASDDTTSKAVTVTSDDAWVASFLVFIGQEVMFSAEPLSGSAGTTTVWVRPLGANGTVSSYTATVDIRCGRRHATLSLTQTGCPWLDGLSGGANYIQATTFLDGNRGSFIRDVTYYDDLGYPVQELSVAGSPGGKTIARQTVWDKMHRSDTVSFLPYVRTSGDASLHAAPVALAEQLSWYGGGAHGYTDSRPYSVQAYETSPVGRPVYTQKEGDAWNVGGGHGASVSYGFNGDDVTEPVVLRLEWRPSAVAGGPATVSCAGDWPSGALRRTRTTGENGTMIESFTDASGRLVCSRSYSGPGGMGTMGETLYAYDFRDSLALVIQPEGAAALRALPAAGRTITMSVDSANTNNAIYREYCFGYEYDGWGNLLGEHVPGGGTTERVFDARDRVVLETNDLMAGRYVLVQYDGFDRVTGRRVVSTALTVSELRQLCAQGAGIPAAAIAAMTTVCELYSAEYFPFGTITDALVGFVDDMSVVTSADVETVNVKGLLKSETVYPSACADGTPPAGGGPVITRRHYYDYMGRVVQVKESASDGWDARYSTKYDFIGKMVAKQESHHAPDDNVWKSLFTEYSYDDRGRLLSLYRELDGDELTMVYYSYDELGRMSTKTFGHYDDYFFGTQSFDYDIHGWTTGISASYNGNGLFSETLRYASTQKPSTAARWDGNIAEAAFTDPDGSHTYAYTYDGIGRLTDAKHYAGTSNTVTNASTERYISYDRNGNITALTRYDEAGTGMPLSFAFTGNRIAADTYDAMGNMLTDSRKGLEFSYNLANLPESVEGSDGASLTYSYLSDGSKWRASANEGPSILYRGSFVYEDDGNSSRISSIAWDEGRISYDSGSNICDEWHVRDHLGSVRAIAGIGNYITGVRELNTYLPFGTRIPGSIQAADNRHRFSGKEEQRYGNFNLGLSDFGARYYDPVTCRWTTRDPLAGKYLGLSPYNYCNNDPVDIVDNHGDSLFVLNLGGLIGHSALLIQNNEGKWQYYSMNGVTFYKKTEGSIGGKGYHDSGEKVFDTPSEFLNSNYNSSGTKQQVRDNDVNNYGFPEGYLIPSSSEQDAKARDAFTKETTIPYRLLTHNCATAVEAALNAGGIETTYSVKQYYDSEGIVTVQPTMPAILYKTVMSRNPGKVIKK